MCPLQGAEFYERSVVVHAARLPSPRQQYCPRERQRLIQLGICVVAEVVRTKLNITWDMSLAFKDMNIIRIINYLSKI